MTQQEANALPIGLYLLEWPTDRSPSLASVGEGREGRTWFAAADWLHAPTYAWEQVTKATPVLLIEHAAALQAALGTPGGQAALAMLQGDNSAFYVAFDAWQEMHDRPAGQPTYDDLRQAILVTAGNLHMAALDAGQYEAAWLAVRSGRLAGATFADSDRFCEQCGKPLPPGWSAVYCSNECAHADA